MLNLNLPNILIKKMKAEKTLPLIIFTIIIMTIITFFTQDVGTNIGLLPQNFKLCEGSYRLDMYMQN